MDSTDQNVSEDTSAMLHQFLFNLSTKLCRLALLLIIPSLTLAEPLNVMSYNIRLDTAADGINAWPYRVESVAEVAGAKYNTHIVGMQEVLHHQLLQLQERMPDYAWVGTGRDDGLARGEFSPIFYQRERLQLLATNTFWLSETPDIPGSRSWDAAITRIVTWARFRDLVTEQQFLVFNTHFDHRGELARIQSAHLIVNAMTAIAGDEPAILLGDLNVPESSEAYAVLNASALVQDARYRSESGHSGATASFNNWLELREDESRIDYVFVSEHFRVLSHLILEDKYDGRYPSDHLPVLAEIVL
jgi:endonuclease/exonuclease/phosphatase family metal-dependent hydrolase